MNRQIISAAILAAAAAGLAYYYLHAKEAAIKAEVTPWFVLVAKRAIGPGARLRPDSVAVREIPAAYVMPGAVASASSRDLRAPWKKLLNQTALAQIARGEQLLPNKFSNRPPGFAAVVPRGLRSAAFSLEAAAANGGHLRPGNRVDVVAVLARSGKGPGGRTAATLVQNVQVLAVGSLNGLEKDGTRPESWGPAAAMDVCLALAPDDVLRLSLAEREGGLKLALRGIGDEQEEDSGLLNLETVLDPLLDGTKTPGAVP